jgi:hypothetical protein
LLFDARIDLNCILARCVAAHGNTTLKLSADQFMRGGATRSAMNKVSDLRRSESGGIVSAYQILTLYFPAFILALGYSIATPAIPVFAKSFDTGFGVASLVIVVHALGGLMAAVPTGFLVDHLGRRPMLAI